MGWRAVCRASELGEGQAIEVVIESNVIALFRSGGQLYAIDRGPGRQDEINVVVAGGNYGWNPASASVTEYQTDGVPMTDLSIANARPAAYNSGDVGQQLGPADDVGYRLNVDWMQRKQQGSAADPPEILDDPDTGQIHQHSCERVQKEIQQMEP